MDHPQQTVNSAGQGADLSEASTGLDAPLPGEQATVSVAMCTYQGERHVEEQLQSVLGQSWPVQLHVSDDASTDDTVLLTKKLLRADVDSLQAHDSNLGYVGNFERSLRHLLESGARYLALADQDDVWDRDRIANGMHEMHRLEAQYGDSVPLLVHSDLQLVDDQGRDLHPSFLQFRRYRIRADKCLVVVLGENGVMGNTVLLNRALAELALPFPAGLHVHDYWLALLAELYGQRGLLREPLVKYRLHQSNASNTAASLLPGRRGWLRTEALMRWLTLDFKLPFKEDSRLAIVEQLLSADSRYPALDEAVRLELEAFVRYLQFEQPRIRSLRYLLSSGVARGGLRYRLRLCLATLITRRYR